MIDKQIIIDDQKETIHRLQQECTEKTNTIIALGEQLQAKEQECEDLKEDRERWKSNFNGKVSAIEELLQQLDQLKKSNEELKNIIKSLQNK